MKVDSIAYCGLICSYCYPDGTCSCKAENHCGKRLSPQGCYQYTCCMSKGIKGCWECPLAPCGKDMLAPEKVKPRAFIRCLKEDGVQAFIGYLERNAQNGIVYHRSGIMGDYDLPSEEDVLRLLRQGR